jgi:hypothetical protein
MTVPTTGKLAKLGHDMEQSGSLPTCRESLVVVMERGTVTIRESGETDAWITSDYMVEL